jgi:ubiquinone/menaquinone biosynthesis C-methylase UbiE
MGTAICLFAQTALGESVMMVTAVQGYQMWSAHYDSTPNPLLALESRMLVPRLGALGGRTVLDVGTGTGRWMSYSAAQGAHTLGLDLSAQMLRVAGAKAVLFGKLVLGDASSLPFESGSFDLAICSFALSYLDDPEPAFAEMARVARRVVITDFHPAAARLGWTRGYRTGNQSVEIEHFCHSFEDLDLIAHASGMTFEWRTEEKFGLPELPLFELAGKKDRFDSVRHTPAVFAASWVKTNSPCA